MSRTAVLTITALLAACGGESKDVLAAPVGLEFHKLVAHDDTPTNEKIELGKTLFFDPRLSKSGKMSCSTCHLPEHQWTDGKQFSTKDDGTVNTRNTPTVQNVGYYEKLYWDGRAPSLDKNVLAAWKAQMSGDPDAVAKTLAGIAGYKEMFQRAYQQDVTADGIVKALAAFLRLLRAGNSPFDRWQKNDQGAVNNDVKVGYELFMSKGCNACHTPPLFSDGTFHNVGIGMDAASPDLGAGGEKALNDPAKRGAFKTPSQRDVARTAPYFHDGSRKTLIEAVKFMLGGGYDNPNKDVALQKREYTEEEARQIVAFLESLSSDVPFTPPQIPK